MFTFSLCPSLTEKKAAFKHFFSCPLLIGEACKLCIFIISQLCNFSRQQCSARCSVVISSPLKYMKIIFVCFLLSIFSNESLRIIVLETNYKLRMIAWCGRLKIRKKKLLIWTLFLDIHSLDEAVIVFFAKCLFTYSICHGLSFQL